MCSEHRMGLKRKVGQKLLKKGESSQTNVDTMFTVPAPPPPDHHGDPGTTAFTSFCPTVQLTSNQKPTSNGTNIQDGGPSGDPSGGSSGALDGNSYFFEPCPPGTKLNLEATVLCETEGVILLGDVKWQNRSYVGTLIDSTKNDWPRPTPWIRELLSSESVPVKSVPLRPKSNARPAAETPPPARLHKSRGGTARGSYTKQMKSAPSHTRRGGAPSHTRRGGAPSHTRRGGAPSHTRRGGAPPHPARLTWPR